ncbi:hypothetical protein Y032_0273g982 [Ancylostoma ceylanicum]|uniref:Metalloendopeptidase n=1 Tax=Ancylostoma ceylanicum TaxID=53326 RepID=A0A016S8U2_9BILA|nr:hypothetical protein Y032_0273g982 [Ancylostoma ceylanicum]
MQRLPHCIRFPGNEGLFVTTLYDACASDVGRVGEWQNLYLGKSCQDFGGMAHELGHALGLLHTMSRRDRDDYIFVDLTNIKVEHLVFVNYQI